VGSPQCIEESRATGPVAARADPLEFRAEHALKAKPGGVGPVDCTGEPLLKKVVQLLDLASAALFHVV
jgi:hypothetical protein